MLKRLVCLVVGHDPTPDEPGWLTYPNHCRSCGELLVGETPPPDPELPIPPPALERRFRVRPGLLRRA